MFFRRCSENITQLLACHFSIILFVTARFVSNSIAFISQRRRPFTEATANWQETNAIDISANKQGFAPNLLYLKLIKCNQRNWSRFKQILKKSPHRPSTGYTIDGYEKQPDWCRETNARRQSRCQGHYHSFI